MSAPEETITCRSCGSPLPAAARFCPECGSRAGDEPPEDAASMHVFGALPRSAGPVAAVVVVVAVVVLFVLGAWIAGALLLALAAAAVAAAAVGRADLHGSRLVAVRARSRSLVEQLAAQSELRRESLRRRAELERLQAERGTRLRALGEAVYREDETGTTEARAAVRELDDRIADQEEEMTHVAERIEERIAGSRLEGSRTQLLEPPQPPDIPEPYPPPDEGTPPAPEPVPEPSPPPDEGTPPQPPQQP